MPSINKALQRNTSNEVLPQAWDGTDFQPLTADSSGRLVVGAPSKPLDQLTSTLGAVGATLTLPSPPAGALRALVTIEGGRIRASVAGAAASATAGLPFGDKEQLELESPAEIAGFSAYAIDAGVKLHIIYYGV